MTTYRWQILRAGPFKLDAGGMFGAVPKALWSKLVMVDDANRMDLALNCLLLSNGSHRVLLETGCGDKLDDKTRKIFGITDYSIIDALAEAGVKCEQITHAIVSHLHFDHAGGLTCRGETGPMLTFPNAKMYVQRTEWDDAIVGRSHMTRTYFPENLDPLRGRIQLIDSPPPFERGYRPRRDELPTTRLEDRETEVAPGVFVFNIPGHTIGLQAIRLTDETGQQVVFAADLIPTVNHVGAAYNMAYDIEPYTSTVTRRWFLTEAAKRKWLVVLDHEPGNPCVKVEPDDKGWFKLLPQMGHR
jgi:glyoxylase-like metal-dependent hydrolase (beta-lactamase superfamily II)